MANYRTKDKSYFTEVDADIDHAYGPWANTAAFESFWTNDMGLDIAIPSGRTIAVQAADGKITKYVRQNGAWVKEGENLLSNVVKSITVNSGSEQTGDVELTIPSDVMPNYATGSTSAGTTITNPAKAPVMYKFDTISSLDISAVVSAKYETIIFFTAGANFTLTASATNQKLVGEIDITVGNSYVIAILNGNFVVQQTTTAETSYKASAAS